MRRKAQVQAEMTGACRYSEESVRAKVDVLVCEVELKVELKVKTAMDMQMDKREPVPKQPPTNQVALEEVSQKCRQPIK